MNKRIARIMRNASVLDMLKTSRQKFRNRTLDQ
jgi:hypothetical protein